MSSVVIVGSSIGGVRTAQALRSEGHDGRIVLVGEEPVLPYDKPPLSKALLGGTTDPAALCLLTGKRRPRRGSSCCWDTGRSGSMSPRKPLSSRTTPRWPTTPW